VLKCFKKNRKWHNVHNTKTKININIRIKKKKKIRPVKKNLFIYRYRLLLYHISKYVLYYNKTYITLQEIFYLILIFSYGFISIYKLRVTYGYLHTDLI